MKHKTFLLNFRNDLRRATESEATFLVILFIGADVASGAFVVLSTACFGFIGLAFGAASGELLVYFEVFENDDDFLNFNLKTSNPTPANKLATSGGVHCDHLADFK